MKYFFSLTFLLISLILTGCSSNFNNGLKQVTIDSHKFQLEIADTPQEREKGLMDRTSLPKNQGMLFVFDKSDYQDFWMKNTLIPLQIIFVDGCKIVDKQEMTVEKDPANPISHYVSKKPANKAIEVNTNTLSTNIVGQQIRELCN